MRRVKPASSSNLNESTLWQTKQTFLQPRRQTPRQLLKPPPPRRASAALVAVDAAVNVAVAVLAADVVHATTTIRTRAVMT